MGLSAPASAAGTTQISGDAALDTTGQCGTPPPPFDYYPPPILTGDLEGCLYSEILTATTTPSGVYHETGRELVVASLNGGPTGRFTTTYKFEAKLDTIDRRGAEGPLPAPDHQRLSGPAVWREPPDGSASRTWSVTSGTFVYRGHITLGSATQHHLPFRRHDGTGQAATSPRPPRRQRTHMP